MAENLPDPAREKQKLIRLIKYIVVNIFLTYVLAAAFYGDPFHFWQHALSELGTTTTLLGTANLSSAGIVMIGMFINGRLLLEIARTYRKLPEIPHHNIKSGLMYLAGLGSFISIFPNNLFHTLHSIGSGLMIGSMFFVDFLILQERLTTVRPGLAYFAIGALLLSVFSYAAAYFAGLPIKQAAQKICLINLLVIFYERSWNLQNARQAHFKPI